VAGHVFEAPLQGLEWQGWSRRSWPGWEA